MALTAASSPLAAVSQQELSMAIKKSYFRAERAFHNRVYGSIEPNSDNFVFRRIDVGEVVILVHTLGMEMVAARKAVPAAAPEPPAEQQPQQPESGGVEVEPEVEAKQSRKRVGANAGQ